MSYNNIWENEFDNIVSSKDRVQDIPISQLKLKVNDVFKKDEKITTNFEPSDDKYVINKAYLDTKLSKIEGHLSLVERNYSELNYLAMNSL